MMADNLFCGLKRQGHVKAVVGISVAVIIAMALSPVAVATSVFEDFNYGHGTLIHGQTPTNAEWKVTVAGLPANAGNPGPKVFDDPGGDVPGRGQALLASQANDPPDAGVTRLVLDNPMSQDFTLSFDYNTNTGVSKTLNLLLGDNPTTAGSESLEGGQIVFGQGLSGEGAFIRYRLAAGGHQEAAFTWPVSAWMEVVVDIQPSAKTYQMSIDGSPVFTDGGWNTALDEVQVFAMERSGGIRTAYLDNLSIVAVVPEPASGALALLAVSLLSGRRWSRRRD